MSIPWFESLTDSVAALEEAARDARRAYRTVDAVHTHYDLSRLRPATGHCISTNPYNSTVRPHDQVLMRAEEVINTASVALAGLYFAAAVAYADGVLWAIGAVQAGEQPAAVEGIRTSRSEFTVPEPLRPINALDRWSGWSRFTAARELMDTCAAAGEYGNLLADEHDLTEYEATDMHEAWDRAAGLPDAAYDFGRIGQDGLRFALLDIRAEHARNRDSSASS